MNLFVLHKNAIMAAKAHCDKHVNKMIIEAAQMLSTAHRVIDGYPYVELSKAGRKIKRYGHRFLDDVLYKSTHVNHPSAVWIRESNNNYNWAYAYFIALCDEYTHRTGKTHATDTKLRHVLVSPPSGIEIGPLTQFKIAINHDIYDLAHVKEPIEAYRRYYVKKHNMQFKMIWTDNKPEWFTSGEYGNAQPI